MIVPVELENSLHRISAQISDCSGRQFEAKNVNSVAGGCINTTLVIGDGATSYFVKLNRARYMPMFEAEADGLRELAAANSLRVPLPLCHGNDDGCSWLVLEYLGTLGARSRPDWNQLGRGLAKLHRHRDDLHGWHRNNTIGSTEQVNSRTADWGHFLRKHRIGFQLGLAARNGFGGRLQDRGERLLDGMRAFFNAYVPEASLLHGDLWSGNVGFLGNGEAVIFDPAVYYGDREADIAMTELFGGFAGIFYNAYQSEWPLDSGYQTRKHLYNLYHLLNHLNLFGQGYLAQCEAMIDRLLAEL
jgi:protein-ribulosamine 3-kinase